MALTSFQLEESIQVAAAPEIVWRFLADPHSWQHWWPGCREAEAKDRKTLHDGSQLTLVLRIGWMTLKFDARVEAATPQRTLLWISKNGGITVRQAFYLDARPNGTFVRQQGSFSGPGALFLRLTRLDHAARRMLQQNLRGLKRVVERAT